MNGYKSEKLPRELKRLLPEAYKENEQDYWLKREILMRQFANKWVAIHDGKVVAVAEDMTGVMDEVGKRGLCDAYIEKVGGEYDTVFTIRRRRGVGFAYDSSYLPPIPRVEVTFSNFQKTRSATYDNVIPDTGSDSTVLPLNDCASFALFSSPFYSSLSHGIDSAPAPTLIYRAFAEIVRHTYSALIEAHPFYSERLLGREVMNALIAIFDGPRGMTRFQF